MEPQVASGIRYNNISPKLREHIKEWEARKGIGTDEPLVFEVIGNGDTRETAYKSTRDVDSMMDAHRSKPTATHNMLNGESIIDPGTNDYVFLTYFPGGYAPGKRKGVVWFKGKDGRALVALRKSGNPALYLHLILSNYLEDNANPLQVEPDGGYLYRLQRPLEEEDNDWELRMAQNEVTTQIATATIETLMWLAPKLNIAHHEGITSSKLRANFEGFSSRNGGHLKLKTLFEANETRMFERVEAAIELGVVAVDRERNVWVFTASQDVICPASPAGSSVDQLVNYLLLADQAVYKQLLALADKAASSKPKKGNASA